LSFIKNIKNIAFIRLQKEMKVEKMKANENCIEYIKGGLNGKEMDN